MKIVLVDLPLHIPTVMPYSIAMMHAILSSSLDEEIVSIDLNAKYHFKEFNEFYIKKDREDYFKLLDKFVSETRHVYGKISKAVIEGKKPKEQENLIKYILDENPDIVAFSITYNSQVFFGKSIIKELLEKKIKVILGGPGDFSKIKESSIVLPDYDSMIKYCVKNGAKTRDEFNECIIDYSIFNKEEYFTKDIVYPLRSAFSCPYKRCAFCTHHQNNSYKTINLDFIKNSILKNEMKKVCFIDDGFTDRHLSELADALDPLRIEWWCQLRPVKSIIPLFPKLKKSGLKSIAWGVESGSQRILDFMEKGTNKEDIEIILRESKISGIKNMVYIMFGFPTETEEDVRETIDFIKKNQGSIDLISPSTFGLQKESRAFISPKKFGIKEVSFTQRTMLSDKINYIPIKGLTQEEAERIKKKYLAEVNKVNKIPKAINACKEQILNLPSRVS